MTSLQESRFLSELDGWLARHRDEMVAALQDLCRIRSVQDEPAPGQPFGPGVAQALAWIRHRAEGFGFRTRDVDGYAVDAEIGEGTEWVAVLAHVDVVPEGSGWTYPPFGAEVHDGKLYARGAVDDKGPTVAALYAMKAVADLVLAAGHRVRRRVRLIVGGNEESGFACVRYYFARNPQPTLGFSPDALFPLVNAEKGIWTFRLRCPVPGAPGPLSRGAAPQAGAPRGVVPPQDEDGPSSTDGDSSAAGDGVRPTGPRAHGAAGGRWRLVRLEGGTRVNVVPDHAVAEVEWAGPGDPGEALASLARRLETGGGPGRVRITARVNGRRLTVEAHGAAAHAMHPEKGLNAVVGLLDALVSHLGADLPARDALAFLAAAGARTDGSGFGIASRDAVSGPLTVNLGLIRLERAEPPTAPAPSAAGSHGELHQDHLVVDCNVRYPVSAAAGPLEERLRKAVAGTGWQVETLEDMPPHHVPETSEIVTTLLEVYREETGDRDARPLAIGGGTYARVLQNGVAFGPVFPGQRELAHEPDEYWSIEDLVRCTRIYTRALYRLMGVTAEDPNSP